VWIGVPIVIRQHQHSRMRSTPWPFLARDGNLCAILADLIGETTRDAALTPGIYKNKKFCRSCLPQSVRTDRDGTGAFDFVAAVAQAHE